MQGIAILIKMNLFYFVLYGHPFKTVLSCLLQVRASSLQELVYKGGQAGVTKATVTITFDNSDKQQSPVGYEMYDELTVSRQVLHHCSICLNTTTIIVLVYILYYILYYSFLLFNVLALCTYIHRWWLVDETSTSSTAQMPLHHEYRTSFVPFSSTSTTHTFSSCKYVWLCSGVAQHQSVVCHCEPLFTLSLHHWLSEYCLLLPCRDASPKCWTWSHLRCVTSLTVWGHSSTVISEWYSMLLFIDVILTLKEQTMAPKESTCE